MSTLINYTAQTHLTNSSLVKYSEYQAAFNAVGNSVKEEIARENFGGPNHNNQWHATDDIIDLAEQAGYARPSEGIGMCKAYLSMLAALPQDPDAKNIGTLLKDVAGKAPQDALERKGYLLAVTLGGAHLAATFATEATLQCLTETLTRR